MRRDIRETLIAWTIGLLSIAAAAALLTRGSLTWWM